MKIAIIGGGGAAGLATARAFQKYTSTSWNNNNDTSCDVAVFEKSSSIGGVWRYTTANSSTRSTSTNMTNTNNNENTTNDSSNTTTTNNNNNNKMHPMYRNLRTNLPKEIMAFREYPWTTKRNIETTSLLSSSSDSVDAIRKNTTINNNTIGTSFVTHYQVYEYLQSYANKYQLQPKIQFNCTVQKLTVLKSMTNENDENDDTGCSLIDFYHPNDNNNNVAIEKVPKIELQWTNSNNEEVYKDVFDGVVICNGHYNKPSIPDNIPGLNEYYQGKIIHSIQYDQPSDYMNQTVLCIGARASGSDIAREIASQQCSSSTGTTHVYLSDSTFQQSEPITQYNVTLVPRTQAVLSNGCIQFGYNCSVTPKVDTIIYCTGYDYDFPFIKSDSSNIELRTGNKCVTPLYQQLWHAHYPNIAFIGIPHSILPFPFFEIQAQAVAYQWFKTKQQQATTTITSNGNKNNMIINNPEESDSHIQDVEKSSLSNKKQLYYHTNIPNRIEREKSASIDAQSGGPEVNGRVPQDTHYLGSYQWDYLRTIAKYYGNFYSKELENYIQTNKTIYEHVGKLRNNFGFPAGPDTYRFVCYERRDDDEKDKFLSYHYAIPSEQDSSKDTKDACIIVTRPTEMKPIAVVQSLPLSHTADTTSKVLSGFE